MNGETLQIIVTFTLLCVGLVVFQYAQRIKKRGEEIYFRYLCYSGLSIFVSSALFIYIGDSNVRITCVIVLFVISFILAVIGKRKQESSKE